MLHEATHAADVGATTGEFATLRDSLADSVRAAWTDHLRGVATTDAALGRIVAAARR